MTTKPKTRKAPPGNGAEPDPVFAAIAEHKVLIRKYIRCRNNSEAARSKAEIKLGKSLQGAALMTAAAEETMLEYNQFSRASKAERIAGMRMARTKPTTTPG